MSGPLKIIPATILLFAVSVCSICQVPDFARVPNMWEGDSMHIVSLIKNGIEIKKGKAICWFPRDSLSSRRMQEIADTLNMGITGAENFMRGSLPKRLPLSAAAYTFYFRTDSFVSHASLAGFVSIPFWRIKEGKAPWLHEAVHEMLTVGEIEWFSKSITDEYFNKHMPLWLSEGLATYVSMKVSQRNRISWFDVFSRSVDPNVDSVFRMEMQSEKSQYILSYIGAQGVMPELSSPDRNKYAPAFYHGSSSFVEFIADEYGLAVLLDAISSFQKEHEVIEGRTGKSIAVLKAEWLKKLKIGS
jgi:hypothetical protein